jgi:hypothetical protein
MYWSDSKFTEASFKYKQGTTFIALFPTEESAWEWECLTQALVNNWDRLDALTDEDDTKKLQLPIWYRHFMKLMSKFEYSRVIPPLRTAGRICHRILDCTDKFPDFESFPVSQGYIAYFEENKQMVNVGNFLKMVRRNHYETTEEFEEKKRKEREEYKQRIKKLCIKQGWVWSLDY